MRGQKGICLLCRYTLKLRGSIPIRKRLASSRANEPYVLPRLVIDLDAADSKIVRKWEDLPEEEKNPAPPKQPSLRGRLESMKKKYGTLEKGKVRPVVPLKTLQTTPADLLAYALLGDPIATRANTMNPQFRMLFRSRMVQPEDSAETKLQQLAYDFTFDETERLRASGFGESPELAVVNHIFTMNVPSRLHRIISMLSRTTEGCLFLARNCSAVLESIRICRKSNKDRGMGKVRFTGNMVLRLLNNLQLNMESKGIEFGPGFSNAGIYYAAKTSNLPAVRKYLQILRANSYATDWRTAGALQELSRAMKFTPHGINEAKHFKKSDFLRLVTGWEEGIPQDGEKRDLSFASILYQDNSTQFTTCLYPRYLLAFGELRRNKALWAEWESMEETKLPPVIRGDHHLRFRARMFAFAFLIGGDKNRALKVLQSVPADHEDIVIKGHHELIENWEYSGGSFSNTPSISSGEWLLTLIYAHYSFNNVWPTGDLLEIMKRAIRDLPKDPQEVLNQLDRFVLRGLEGQGNERKMRYVGWERNDTGQEGLSVMRPRPEGNGPQTEYWRPKEVFAEPLF
ncbi:hypothetical protein L207DRAFT_512316 [Hyaloscypha variabilis F]|uniref:Uncharacterized protein n=1 Tax=Hyaloscypha variabilis (strain UAMH 11265 / GT02V1 / F) TaxID=1149755 RepID=A0A2J6RQW4_HYAVF|nr:hypothetical protein L207DRAFT_512316 [Hyaloscypha variabilis F]